MQRGSVLVHYENAVISARRKYFYSTGNCNIDACMAAALIFAIFSQFCRQMVG